MTSLQSAAKWWHPDEFDRRRPLLVTRQKVLRATRLFFEQQSFSEVETPALQISPGLEAHLHAFATCFESIPKGSVQNFYLHTSPEFSMKKLLVAGMENIFQLSHVFRNGERSSRHHPEFSMLEWYRKGAHLPDLMADCEKLVRAAAQAAGLKQFSINKMICDPFLPWERLSVPEAFRRYANIDLMSTIGDAEHLRAELVKAGFRATNDDNWDDLFFRVMGERIEPELGRVQPTILCDYPVSMAALARPKLSDPRLADRFELYICGYEIANAFDELTDAVEQRRRFEFDIKLKREIYGVTYPLDEDFLDALAFGMPDCSGIALGFDRLVMLCAGAEDIEDVLWAPVA